MKDFRQNLISIGWAVKLALKINPGIFVFWGLLATVLAILPAIALSFNRQAVSIISSFLSTGYGEFSDVVPSIVILGGILIVVGVSRRITGNFLYFIMFDAYYHGLQEYFMDIIRHIEIKTMMKKEYRDDYHFAAQRCGSLADFMSSGTVFLSKLVGVVSLLVVAATVSSVIFAVAAIYVAVLMIFNTIMAEKLRWDGNLRKVGRLSNHYQNSAMSPGVAKEMRVYGLADEFVDKWDKAYDKVEAFDKRFHRLLVTSSFITGIGFYAFMVGMLTYSIFQVANGSMTVDVFLMLYVMGENISSLIRELTNGFREMYRGLHILAIQRRFINSAPK